MVRLDETQVAGVQVRESRKPEAPSGQDSACPPEAIRGMIVDRTLEGEPCTGGHRWPDDIERPRSADRTGTVSNMQVSTSIVLNSVIEPERLALVPMEETGEFEIRDQKTGNRLGSVRQPEVASHTVELFFGKGGFMAMITSPKGARYFALPGASVSVGGTRLILEGCAITSNVGKKPSFRKTFTPQKYSTQATILGAGLATRFERISGDSTDYSKPAVPLAGKSSVIECIASGLLSHGFNKIIVNTYFKPASLKAGLSRCEGIQVRYIDESEPSGTAGGLRKMLTEESLRHFLDLNQPLLVVQGDSVTDASFSDLMEAHIANQALVTIGCQLVAEKDVDKFGIIVTDQSGSDGQSGKITGFQEKPKPEDAKSRLGNTGFYIFSPKAFPLIKEIYENALHAAQTKAKQNGQPVPSEIQLDFATDIFPAILKHSQQHPESGAFWAETVDGYWSDIGNPVQYLESVHDLYAGKVNIPLPPERDAYYRDGIVFWEGAYEIAQSEGASLTGNVVVAMPFSG